MQQNAPEAAASAQYKGSSGSTTWANKAFECLRCVGYVAAWTLLLLCTELGHHESFAGILVVVLAVPIVTFRSRCEITWRGLMLVFSVTLLAIINSQGSLCEALSHFRGFQPSGVQRRRRPLSVAPLHPEVFLSFHPELSRFLGTP
ncbi:unnamed protein product [Ectocarpus sp. 13 AM-2016]